MTLGITARVTSRKWTLGPSYVNNSRVIETLLALSLGSLTGRHPLNIHLLWPGAGWPPDHFRRPERATLIHQPLTDHQSPAETLLRFFVTIIPSIKAFFDVRMLRQRTNRGAQCVAICCFLCHYVSTVSTLHCNDRSTDHRHWGQRGRLIMLWQERRIFRWLCPGLPM